jgi:hypothetical protein
MKQIALATAFALTLVGSFAGHADAKARRHLSSGTPTNYGAAIIGGVYVTFVCTTSCVVQSPTYLYGRTVVRNADGTWRLL